MKLLLAYLLTSVACVAGDMIRTTEADFKKPKPDYLKAYEEVRPKLDISKDEDRKTLDSLERVLYEDAMMEVSESFFRLTKLKKGDDWRKLWSVRQQAALEEVASDMAEHESLQKAFLKLREFEEEGDAVILERVVRAKFGGDLVWILLVHWEREESVMTQIESGKEAVLGHYYILAVRASDQKIISKAMCG